MNTYARKSEDFNQRIDFKFKEQIKKLDQSNIEQIQKIKEIENESMKLNEEYEKEIVIIKEKYIKKNEEIINKRKEEIEKLKEINKENVNYWSKVLVNSKLTNEPICPQDYDVLKSLTNIKIEYLDKEFDNFKLIFEFDKNEYFTNKTIEKEYHFSKDKLISKIVSTEIKWKKDKNYAQNKVKKCFKNKKTKETKEIEICSPNPSFFNFFCNVVIPDKKQLSSLSFKDEKELSDFLDKEYEIAMELKNEIIPHASEYYIGLIQDIEEYQNYLEKNIPDFDM